MYLLMPSIAANTRELSAGFPISAFVLKLKKSLLAVYGNCFIEWYIDEKVWETLM